MHRHQVPLHDECISEYATRQCKIAIAFVPFASSIKTLAHFSANLQNIVHIYIFWLIFLYVFVCVWCSMFAVLCLIRLKNVRGARCCYRRRSI